MSVRDATNRQASNVGKCSYYVAPAIYVYHFFIFMQITPTVDSASNISDAILTATGTKITTSYTTPLWIFIINIISTYVCYAFGKFTCKILIQGISYALPINLVVPVTLSGLIAMCGLYINNECSFYNTIPNYLFFNCPNVYFLEEFVLHHHSWIWLVWLLSHSWVTMHIWNPSSERLARTEKLFVKPMYDAFFIDQSLALNRRRHDKMDDLEVQQSLGKFSWHMFIIWKYTVAKVPKLC